MRRLIVVPPESTPRLVDVLDSIEARLGKCARSTVAVAAGGLMALSDLHAAAPPHLLPLVDHALKTMVYLATIHHGVAEGDLEAAVKTAEADTADFLKNLNQGESP